MASMLLKFPNISWHTENVTFVQQLRVFKTRFITTEETDTVHAGSHKTESNPRQ